jgi:hypothetical protein
MFLFFPFRRTGRGGTGGGERWRRRSGRAGRGCRSRTRSLGVVAERRSVVVGVVRGGAGGGELEEEVAEVGDGAGDAERAGVAVPVLLRGAAEQRGEGRAAEELGAHGVALHGAALLADAHGHVALRHARAAAQPPRAGRERGRLPGRRRVRPARSGSYAAAAAQASAAATRERRRSRRFMLETERWAVGGERALLRDLATAVSAGGEDAVLGAADEGREAATGSPQCVCSCTGWPCGSSLSPLYNGRGRSRRKFALPRSFSFYDYFFISICQLQILSSGCAGFVGT